MANVDKSKQIQHDKIEPIRSSSKRDLSFENILHFFDGGSSTSSFDINNGVSFTLETVFVVISAIRLKNKTDEIRCDIVQFVDVSIGFIGLFKSVV